MKNIDKYKAFSGYAIKIFDSYDNVLSVELEDIIEITKPYCKKLIWTFLNLWAIGKEDSVIEIVPLIDEIERTGKISFTYSDLIELTPNFFQIIDCLIVGHYSEDAPQKGLSLEESCLFANTVIQAFDSTYWFLYSKNENIIINALNKYKNITKIDK
jgi:hypothetical protein